MLHPAQCYFCGGVDVLYRNYAKCISLSGLALGVGMLVDNSIVVIENIYRLRKEGVPVKEAAITGARGVAGAITSSTLNYNFCIPADRIHDRAYKTALCGYGLTIGYSLVASLIVAVTFVPMMSAGVLNKVTQKIVSDQ